MCNIINKKKCFDIVNRLTGCLQCFYADVLERAMIEFKQKAAEYPDAPGIAWEFFESVKKELKTKNRFSNEKLDRLISHIINEKSFHHSIKPGTVLYRSRIYNRQDAVERHRCPPENDPFKGYDREGSYINPVNDSVGEGRCNPEYISYLYVSQSVDCCVHETSPNIYSYISVAEIKVKEELEIFDLGRDMPVRDGKECIVKGVPNSILLYYLYLVFSSPYEEYGDYFLSQYISEKIKNHGFDGISFRSAVYAGSEGNTNYVIFNYHKCEPAGSRLYKVNRIDIKYE